MVNESQSGDCRSLPLPERPAHVHLLGICGTGMAALAGMFQQWGSVVTGSDQGIYPPMSDFLLDLGIRVTEGYHPSNLIPKPDLVVVGNVIRRANPEAVEVEGSGIPFTSLPEALATYFTRDKTRIVVAGTHGKTSVSSMIAWILGAAGMDPGFVIGGITGNFQTNHRIGGGRFFVIEGDEYDSAYFDKRPKFMHYQPQVGVFTSCEFDHADIYRNIEEIEAQFRAFISLIPSSGSLIACGDDPRVNLLAGGARGQVSRYGFDTEAEWSAREVLQNHDGIRLTVVHAGCEMARGTLPVIGNHNVLNALGAVAAAQTVGIELQDALKALGSYRGVSRRQQVLGEADGILVMDDIAHHPTAVRETCAGVRARYPHRRLIAVFEPRTNTSRRAVFQDIYVSALLGADMVLAREPREPEKFPENDRFSSRRLAADLRAGGTYADAFEDTDGLLDSLCGQVREGDVVLIMSNGSFDGVGRRLLGRLRGAVS